MRDKDGIAALRILVGEAARLRKTGRTLYDLLEELRAEHGYFVSHPFQLTYTGPDGPQMIADIVDAFRTEFPLTAGQAKLIHYKDFANRTIYRPSGDVTRGNRTFTATPFAEDYLRGNADNLLSFHFDDGSWYALRPSGTEPKLKFYVYAVGENETAAKERIDILSTTVSTFAELIAR